MTVQSLIIYSMLSVCVCVCVWGGGGGGGEGSVYTAIIIIMTLFAVFLMYVCNASLSNSARN